MQQEQSLEKILRARTLRRALVVLAALSCALLVAAAITVERELNSQHQQRLEQFATELDRNLQSLRQQVRNLARNNLIINSLIDYSNRDSYLPVFFRSLELTVTGEISIVFTDFQGQLITGKNKENFAQASASFDWQSDVLGDAKDFIAYNQEGVMVASPVLYANFAEGAIAVHVANLDSIVPSSREDETTLLVDHENRVLYSSDQQVITPGEQYNATKLNTWYISTKQFGPSKIVNLEPLVSAYGEMIWLFSSVIIALFAVLVGTIYAIRTSASLAASSLSELEHSISDAIEHNTDPSALTQLENEPSEFKAIRQSFFVLMANLAATSISRDKFEGVINSLEEVLLVVDNQHVPLIKNASYLSLCKRLNLDNDHAMQALIPDELMQLSGVFSLSVEKAYSYQSNDGQLHNLILRWERNDYKNAQGEHLGYIFVASNVTQEKLLQSELQIKNQAVDEAATPIVLVDAQKDDMPIVYVNQAFVEMTGYHSTEVVGMNCRFLQGKDTATEHIEELREAISEQRSHTTTLLNYRKDGSPFFNELSITPIFNENNVLTHFLGIQVDVTERERSERYLIEAKEKAEESARLKSDFLATMSHEIRTPINGVMGMLNLLLGTDLDKDQRHHAQLAKSSADSLLNIINDILDFSKVEAGKLTIENIQFDLFQLFSTCVESFAQKAQDKGLELVVDTSGIHFPMVQGDPGRLRQVLNNLIANAIKFTERGDIHITADLLRGKGRYSRLICSVRDTGIGISSKQLEHIFDVFSQADASTTRRYGGTGLGLSICKQLCELMGGVINASSIEGKGSHFSFEIELTALDTPSKLLHYTELNGMPILVVDDNSHTRTSVGNQLQQWQADVRTSGSAREALDSARQRTPELVIIDQNLDDEDGVELGRQIKKLCADNEPTLVLMTDIAQRANSPYFRTMGFHYSFPKPATIPDLQHALHVASKLVDPAEASGESESPATITNKTLITNSGRKHRVLLVEDNQTNQLVAKTLLEGFGVEVDIAGNGKEALELLNIDKNRIIYSVVFMDCQMPEMDGFECTREIRAAHAGENYRDIAIIAMTANAMQGDRERCLKSGMSDYISKPIDPNEVQRKLEHWLGLVTHLSGDIESPDLPQLEAEVWNRERALERMMKREDLLKAVATSFLEDLPKLIDSLSDSIGQDNMTQTKYYAHTIKGSSSNLGGDQLAQIALELELAAKDGKRSLVARHWSDLQSAVEKLSKLLEDYTRSAQTE